MIVASFDMCVCVCVCVCVCIRMYTVIIISSKAHVASLEGLRVFPELSLYRYRLDHQSLQTFIAL